MSDFEMDTAEKVASEHQMTTSRRTTSVGTVYNTRACTCGEPLDWDDWERALLLHQLCAAICQARVDQA